MLRDNRYSEKDYRREPRERARTYEEEEAKVTEVKAIDTEVKQLFVEKQVATPLYVRKTPGGKIVDQLHTGEKVKVIGEKGEWSQIGEERYVMTKFLI